MSDWIRNDGTMPKARRVDLRFNEDEPNAPRICMERYNELPERWDWQSYGLQITHYRVVEAKHPKGAADER